MQTTPHLNIKAACLHFVERTLRGIHLSKPSMALSAFLYAALLLTCLIPRALTFTPPHIVLIVADDLGWNDVGFHGSEIKTPNIDKLAYEGVILNNYYVSPICTPTRGCLMTGRYPIHLGLQHYVISAPEPWGLPLNHTTMAGHLKHLGYATHIVGKWHLGFFKTEYLPTRRGFDSHVGYWSGKEDYYTHMDQDGYWGLDFRRDMAVVNETFYSTEQYTKEALKILEHHNKSQPLFLYLAHQAVHAGNGNAPLQAPQRYVDRFPYILDHKRRIFAGMTAALDDSVGTVVSALHDLDMIDNTIIVFTTDNGGPANNYDGNAACNYPLRGTKNTLWEGGVHGVGFVHSRLLNVNHTQTHNLVHVSDWLPTLYGAAGGDVADLGNIDGVNLWDMLKNSGPNVRSEVLHNIDPRSNFSAISVDDYKLIQGDISGGRNDGWYPCNPPSENQNFWKPNAQNFHNSDESLAEIPAETRKTRAHNRHTPYVIDCGPASTDPTAVCDPSTAPCLFHIPSDPCEFNNIAQSNPGIVRVLQKALSVYAATAVEPVNRPPDKNANPTLHGGVWGPWQ
ncbi:arylsulfatase B-like isoform X2 [Dreissena polymorpha]|uniref:Sulfatase N-terminal domain-containing protein n=1 Tax=Dreissena polymorpha TaxID=45954 RepID=A0A9D4M5H1_DREPO|nr:arylsulfatase B-like isoform X2 [Dreissena polymorpha]KAH3868736.1 hypothetical protein DPMN_031888 [Dreissena polymorpha]